MKDALEDFLQTIETPAERLLRISEEEIRQPLSEGNLRRVFDEDGRD